MRGTIRQRAPRWIVALIWGALLLDGGCIQAPTFPTIGPPAPHGSGFITHSARVSLSMGQGSTQKISGARPR